MMLVTPANLREAPNALDNDQVQVHHVLMEAHTAQPGWEMPDNVPLFTMAVVAKAAGVSPNTVRSWFQRGFLEVGGEDSRYHIKGAATRFTLRTVTMIAIGSDLIRLGQSPQSAFAAAQDWQMVGELEGQFGAPATRQGGELYPHPFQTLLISAPEDWALTGRQSRVVAVDGSAPNAHAKLFGAIFYAGRPGARAVWLNAIVDRVRSVCERSIVGDKAAPEVDWAQVVAAELGDEGEAEDSHG